MTTKKFIGEKYGRLTVTGRLGIYAQCTCDCGATCCPRMDALRSGQTKSCGCLARDLADQQRKPVAPPAPKPKRSAAERKLRAVHSAMLQRCTNPNNADYARYGGRGIYVAAEWANVEAFLAWALPLYRPGVWVERVDNDGPYSPGNCVLSTPKRQGRNRSNTLWVASGEKRRPLPQVAAYLQIPYQTAYRKYNELVRNGKAPEVSDFTPMSRRQAHPLEPTEPTGGTGVKRQ